MGYALNKLVGSVDQSCPKQAIYLFHGVTFAPELVIISDD